MELVRTHMVRKHQKCDHTSTHIDIYINIYIGPPPLGGVANGEVGRSKVGSGPQAVGRRSVGENYLHSRGVFNCSYLLTKRMYII